MADHPLTSFTNEFLAHYKLTASAELLPRLTNHMDALVFNMVAVACVVAMLHDKKTITLQHLKSVDGYVDSKCGDAKKQMGGTSMPSDFYGYPHPQYAEGNVNTNHTNLETIDFASGTARAALGPALELQTGGSHTNNKELDAHVRRVLTYHNMKIAKDAKHMLDTLVRRHLKCFAKSLRGKSKSSKTEITITESKLGAVLEKKQFAIFV